jgi:hypothetical protein
MSVTSWMRVVTVVLLAVGAVACSSQPQDVAQAPVLDAATPVLLQGDEPIGDGLVPMFHSGSATPAPEEPVVVVAERPAPPEGVQRAVSIDAAREGVPFALLEPRVLPEETYLTIVQLIEVPEGQTSPTLPAVRLVYDVDGRGVIVLHQSPARAEAAEGEPVDIGGVSGTMSSIPNAVVLTWERDGVRLEMRGSGMDLDDLLEIAAGMAPGPAVASP